MPIQFPDSFWEETWTSQRHVQGQIQGAVLAAGLGRRLEPLTSRHLPKPLFPLGGKVPIAELWVRRFLESGITDVSLNICVLADMMRRYFKDGSKYGMQLQLVDEEIPTGTLGGICKQVLGRESKVVGPTDRPVTVPKFEGSTIIAPSGDIVTNFGVDLLEQMYDIHKKKGAALTIVVTPIPENRKKDFGTVILESTESMDGQISLSGRVSAFLEKDPNSPSSLSNASIYMIERELLEQLDVLRTPASVDADDPFYDFGKHVFPAMLGALPQIELPKDLECWAVRYDGGWFDVGNKRDYLKVQEPVLDGTIDVPLTYEKLPWGYLGSNVSIDFSKVNIVPPVVIGNDCIIEAGATLGPYAVIGDGWIVERGASIHHSVLWERYPYFSESGIEIPVSDRLLVDRHEVRRNVSVGHSIVAGGTLDSDVSEETVYVREDGTLERLSIDYVPEGPRA